MKKIKIILPVLAVVIIGLVAWYIVAANGGNVSRNPIGSLFDKNDEGENDPNPITDADENADENDDSSNDKKDTEQKSTLQPPVISTLEQAGDEITVRTVLNDIKSGTCTLTLSQDSRKVTKSVPVGLVTSYYTCQGFDVPTSDLGSTGTWSAVVKVESNGESANSATQTIEVN